MFEELRDDQQFRMMTREQRRKYFESYKQKQLKPMLDAAGDTDPELQEIIFADVEQEFNKVAYKSSWEEFKTAIQDLVFGAPGRLVTSLNQATLPLEKVIASAMDAVMGDDLASKGIEEKRKRLEADYAHYTFNADAARYNDAAVQGVAFGGLVAGAIAGSSVGAVQMTGLGSQAATNAMRASMFSEGVESVITEAVLDHAIEPVIDSMDWDDSTKGYAKGLAALVAGLGGGFTYGYKLDKMVRNPLFVNHLQDAIEAAKKGPFPNLTHSENVLWHLANSPEKIRQLRNLIEPPQGPNYAKQPTLSSIIEGRIGERQIAEAVEADLAEDALDVRARTRANAEFEKQKLPTIPLKARYSELTPEQQQAIQLQHIQMALEAEAKVRAKRHSKPNKESAKQLLETEEAVEILEGPKLKVRDSAGNEVPEAPRKWQSRTTRDGHLVVRLAGDARPTADEAKALREAGVTWQSKKMMDPSDAKTTGVYYGKATPEAIEVVNKLLSSNGKAGKPAKTAKAATTPKAKKQSPKPAKPAKTPEGKRAEGLKKTAEEVRAERAATQGVAKTPPPIEFVDATGIPAGQVMLRVNEMSERSLEVVKQLESIGFKYDPETNVLSGKSTIQLRALMKKHGMEHPAPKAGPQSAEAAKLKETVEGAQKVKNLPTNGRPVPMKSDKAESPLKWTRVVNPAGVVAVTPIRHGVRESHAWISDEAVLQRAPLVHADLSRVMADGLPTKSIKEGFTLEDLLVGMKRAYNDITTDVPESMKLLEQYEDLFTAFQRQHQFGELDAKDWTNNFQRLINNGVMTAAEVKLIGDVLKKFKKIPNVRLGASKKYGLDHSTFKFLHNLILLDDPSKFMHEVGHWIWFNGLGKAERLQFYKLARTKYGEPDAWNAFWPQRKVAMDQIAKGNKKYPASIVDTHLNSVTEMYADMFSKYVHTYLMPDAAARAILAKGLKRKREFFKLYKDSGVEIPTDIRRLIDRVFNMPTPKPGKRRLNEVEDIVQRQTLYVDFDTFRQTMQSAVDGQGRMMEDQWLMQLLNVAESGLDALKRGTMDLEGVLNRLYRDTLAAFHLDVGDVETIEKAMDKLRDIFEPHNKSEVLNKLKTMGTRHVRNAYGEVTDEIEHTMATSQTLQEAKIKLGKETKATNEHYERGAQIQYQALKEFYNELGLLVQAKKFHDAHFSKRRGKAVEKQRAITTLAQEEWGELQMRLIDEELMRRGEMVSLDAAGDIDEFALRNPSMIDEFSMEDLVDFRRRHGDDYGSDMDSMFRQTRDEELRLLQLRLWPQVASAYAGLQTDDENGVPIPFSNVTLSWSPTKWFESGWGPALSAYSMFGKGLRARGKAAILNKWDGMSPEIQQAAVQKFNAVARHPAVRIWREGDGLPQNLKDIVQEKRMITNRVRTQFYDAAAELNKKFSLDEQRLIAQIVTDRGSVDISKTAPEVVAAADSVNRMFKGIKEELKALAIPEEMLKGFGEDYLPQVFNAHVKNWWMRGTAGRRLYNMYETINAKILAPAGITTTLRSEDPGVQTLMAQLRQSGIKVKPGDVVEEFTTETGDRMFMLQGKTPSKNAMHAWTVKSYAPHKGQMTVNRKYSNLERQLLREETSVVPRLIEFADQASKMIALSKSFEKIAGDTKLAMDPADLRKGLGDEQGQQAIESYLNRGYVMVPETEAAPGIKRYGAMAGKLVDSEAMYAMRVMTSHTGPEHPELNRIFTKYKTGIQLWKIGKTAFNVTTHGINFIGNTAMSLLDGRNPLDVLWKGGRALFDKGDLYKQAMDAGMLDSNILRSELGLERFMRMVESMPNENPSRGMESAMAAWISGVSKGTKTLAKNAAYWPMRIYEMGDQIYKLGVFAQEIEKGASAKEALHSANRLFFDYSDVPTSVKYIRDWGVIPFISYTYKLIPRMVDFAVNNPHRLVLLLGTLDLANKVIMTQEWGEDFEDVRAWQQDVMPDWMNRKVWGNQRGGLLTGQKRNEFGNEYSQWLDYSQVIPGADLLNDGGIFRGLPFGSNPFISIAYGLAANKDATLGRQIAPYPEADNPEMIKRNTIERLKFVSRTLLPNLPIYPGAYSLERLGQALTASGAIDKETANVMGWTGMDYYGTPEDIATEMLSYVTGIRNRRLYAEQETVRRMDKLEFGIKKEENALERSLQDRRTSSSELESQINKYEATVLHNTDQQKRLGQAYEKAQRALARKRRGR